MLLKLVAFPSPRSERARFEQEAGPVEPVEAAIGLAARLQGGPGGREPRKHGP